MSGITDTVGFKIFAFIASGFFAGLFLANVIYYSRIRSAGGCANVTKGEANAMLILNIILFIVAIIMFIWVLVSFFVSPKRRQEAYEKAAAAVTAQQEAAAAYLRGPQGYYPFDVTRAGGAVRPAAEFGAIPQAPPRPVPGVRAPIVGVGNP